MVQRKIEQKTSGSMLIKARNRKNISLDEASKDIGISFKYLEALEFNKLKDLPSDDEAKDMLEKYCHYLEVDFDDCWSNTRKDTGFLDIKKIGDVEKKYFMSWPKLIRRVMVLALIAAILIFLALKVEQIFTPPYLDIAYPIDGSIVEVKQITISGQSEAEVELMVNNKEIFVDETGSFETTIDLQKGLNLIKITAKKRYSREQEKEIRLLFKD